MYFQISDASTCEQFKLFVKHTFIQVQRPNVEASFTHRRRKSEPPSPWHVQSTAPTEFHLRSLPRRGTPICSTPSSSSSAAGDELGDTDSIEMNAFGSCCSNASYIDVEDAVSVSSGSMLHGRPAFSHTSTACPSEADGTTPEDVAMQEASWPYVANTHVDDSAWAWPSSVQGTLQQACESSHPTMVCGITASVLSTASKMQHPRTVYSIGSELLSTVNPRVQTSPCGSGATDDIGFSCVGGADAAESHTTVMVRNLNKRLTQSDLVQRINEMGHRGLYDFAYMPMNFREEGNFGYAFVNFRSPTLAVNFTSQACIVEQDSADDSQRWQTSWSTCQGIEQNIERYRNSPLLHEVVPGDSKPTMFDERGGQLQFPSATKAIRKPRIHRLTRNDKPNADKAQKKGSDSSPEPSPKASKEDGNSTEEHRTGRNKQSHPGRAGSCKRES